LFKEIYTYRRLIIELLRIELLAEYKKSFLGFVWIFVRSFFPVVLWYMMNRAGLFNPGDTTVPYPLFLLTGMSLWNLLFNTYDQVNNALVQHAAILNESKFPHISILIVKALGSLFYFILPYILICGLYVGFGYMPIWKLFVVPFTLLPLFLIGMGMGMAFAVIRVILPDLLQLTDRIVAFSMYLTPVIYMGNRNLGLLGKVMRYNPLTYLLGTPRDFMAGISELHLKGYCISTVIALVVFLACYYFFHKTERRSIELLIY